MPKHYELRLAPDLNAATYDGEVTIDIQVSKPSAEIILNASGTGGDNPDMRIESAVLSARDGTSFKGEILLDPANERIAVKVDGTVGKGAWKLKLKFSGKLNDKLKGFYRSRYKDSAGNEQVLASTQFQSTDARRAFPCFDEPDMKATFKVSLIVDSELSAVSNSRVLKCTSLPGKKKRVDFAKTMKMSSYLLAFVVGKLDVSKTLNVDGVDVRVFTVPGKLELSKFSLEVAAFSLRYFSRYFGCPYPGDKMDMLGIPDFAAGAMENLGCVTFREESLLVDPESASQAACDRVAEVVAHEIAHMWFGDLVTMEWWDGIWLNEAFATFMAAKCVDAWKRHWGVWDKFALARGTAMRTDALQSTRPIQFKVEHPDEAQAMFDVLTYEKGCSVMRMLEQYVGEELFRQGIALYMARHAYGNTRGEDLWAALSETSKQDVAKIMEGWVYKPGFPVLSVSTGDTAGSIVLSQSPFKFLSQAVDQTQVWTVPVFMRAKTSEGVSERKFLLTDKEMAVHVGEGLDWVVINAGGHGFMRVRYDKELSSGLTTKGMRELSVVERYNLVADSWACVKAGMASTDEFLAIAALFDDETDPNVWSAVNGGLSAIRDILPEANRPAFETLVRSLLQPTHMKLGWDQKSGESLKERELRAKTIAALGSVANDPSVAAESSRRYAAWKTNRASIDPNLVGPMISICAGNGDQALFDEFFQSFQKAGTPQEEQHFLDALAAFRDESLLKTTLQHALDPQKIRTQDAPFTVAAVLRNSAGSQHAWEFIKANWDTLLKLYPESGMVRMCQAVSALDDPAMEAEARAFFSTHEVPSGKKQIEQALEMLRINVLFKARELPKLLASYPAPQPSVSQ
ncbi:MAG: M1 family metallopeptidase [Candidatus Obscuribacterales bacterium]|nr:M1 family metallopeptidase [Candidatus Obscuribacterales bacterium]